MARLFEDAACRVSSSPRGEGEGVCKARRRTDPVVSHKLDHPGNPCQQDEDLVDDTLEDVSLSADAAITAIPTDATPSVDFDENDAYDDGYDTGDAVGVAGVEDAMYQ